MMKRAITAPVRITRFYVRRALRSARREYALIEKMDRRIAALQAIAPLNETRDGERLN